MGHRLSASIRLPAVRSEGSSVYMMRTCFEKRAFGGTHVIDKLKYCVS